MAEASHQRRAARSAGRPDRPRGVGWWGVGTLVASEAALFSYLLFAYFYTGATARHGWVLERTPEPAAWRCPTRCCCWPRAPSPGGANGAFSSERRAQALLGFGLAFLMGTVFALVQCYEWHTKPFSFGTSSYGSLYFLTTGPPYGARASSGCWCSAPSFCGPRWIISAPDAACRCPPVCCTGTSSMWCGCLCSRPITSPRTWGLAHDCSRHPSRTRTGSRARFSR